MRGPVPFLLSGSHCVLRCDEVEGVDEEYLSPGHEIMSRSLWGFRVVQRKMREIAIRDVWLTMGEEYERRGYIWQRAGTIRT